MAILSTDLLNYHAIFKEDEARALYLLKKQRELLQPIFSSHRGRVAKVPGGESGGTGLKGWLAGPTTKIRASKLPSPEYLVLFDSAIDAASCAVEIQRVIHEYNRRAPHEKDISLRMGIHVGEVEKSEGELIGEGVAVASRLCLLVGAGELCISEQVYQQVSHRLPHRPVKIEPQESNKEGPAMDAYKFDLLGERGAAKADEGYEKNRMAVLPFANISPDPGDEYFADGMTEEIISTISKIDQIGVISRTSVMQYKKVPKSVREISRELGVGTVLEGSVRKAGNKVRITVQMIDAVKDRHMWAETYDRDLQDVFAIQSDVARQVAEALKLRILPHDSAKLEMRPTTNTQAYILYLEGRYHWNKRALVDVREAAEYFGRAIKEDPSFALGYVGLGDCYHTLITNFGVDPVENRVRVMTMVAKALELDPGLAEAHATRGVALFSDFDLRGAEEEFRKATELKPIYASAHQWYSQLLIAEMRWDEALWHIEKAVELDPLSLIMSLVHTVFYEARRDFATGLELAKRAAEMNPNNPSLHIQLAWFYGKLKMFSDAKREAEVGAELASGSFPHVGKGLEAMTAYWEGDRQAVARLLPELEAHLGETFTTVQFIADLHFYLGEVDRGFEWLEQSYSRKEFDLIYIKSSVFLDDVRNDPRYLNLLKRLGLEETPNQSL